MSEFGSAGLARRQRAAVAGVIEAVVAAMRNSPQDGSVAENGLETLHRVCAGPYAGPDAAAAARRQSASEAGAKMLAERAVAAFPDNDGLQGIAAEILGWL